MATTETFEIELDDGSKVFDGESVDDFILRYADENHEGKPPVSRYPVSR